MSGVLSPVGLENARHALGLPNKAKWNAAIQAATPAAYSAASAAIAEGLGAILRKFCDSDAAMKAREHLHKMPEDDWKVLVDMLSEAAVDAAFRTLKRGGGDE